MARSSLAVLIPNYNDSQLLPRVLNSVLSQSRVPDEVWVSDDASTDNSLEVLEDFSLRHPQIKVLRNQQNAGIPENSFRPFRVTECDYIYTLATDEYLVDPDIFQKASDILDSYPTLGMVCWDHTTIHPDGQIFSVRLQESAGALSPDEVAQRLALAPFPLLTNNALMRRSACMEPGTLCPEAAWNSDWICCLNIAFRHGLYYLPGIYNHFPVRSDGIAERSRMFIHQPLRKILDVLNERAYADVRPYYVKSKAIAFFIPESVEVLLTRPANWEYLSLRMLVRYCKVKLVNMIPGGRRFLKRLKKWRGLK